MAYTEFYIRTGGNDCNAGSTNTDSATVTSTNGGWSTVTNIFTAAAGTPFSGVSAGDWASITTDAASTSAFHARITSVNSGGASITLSSTARSGTAPTTTSPGMTCRVGGAWKNLGGPGAFLAGTSVNSSGNYPRVNLTGTHSYTTAQTFSVNNGTAPVTWEGYSSSPGDGGYAVIDGGTSGASYNVISVTGTQQIFKYFWCQNNGATGTTQWFNINSGNGRTTCYRCTVSSCRGNGFRVQSGNNFFVECEAFGTGVGNGGNMGGFNLAAACTLLRCWSHDNTLNNCSGFNVSFSGCVLIDCIASGNTGSVGGGLVIIGNVHTLVHNCTFYGNRIGIYISSASLPSYTLVENCYFEGNTSWAISGTVTSVQTGAVFNCAYYNNGGGAHLDTTNSTQWTESGSVDLGTSGLNNPSNGDYTPVLTDLLGVGKGNFINNGGLTYTPLSYPNIGAISPAVTSANTIAAAIWTYAQRSLT